MSIFKIKFYFCILRRFYVSIIVEKLTNKVQFFVTKKENCTVLLPTLIFELNQMSSWMGELVLQYSYVSIL